MGFELDYPIKIEELPELDQEWKPALLTREELGANRVDLKRKHLEINVSEAEIRKAKASKLPKISLNSAYTWSDDKLNDIDKITDSNYNFSISVSCQFPIFDSNRTGSLIQQGKIKMENSITLYDKALDDAVLEHYKAYLSCSNALSRWQLYVDRIGEAKESVRFSTERYKVGSATLLEVIQSQVALTQVQVARSQARYDFEIALALFKKTTGRDLEDFGETNN
jgi:outer membrane protein